MVETVLRRTRGRRRTAEPMAVAAARFASMGWPVCTGAHPPRQDPPGGTGQHWRPQHRRTHYQLEVARSCSCDRVGCPAPGAHPVSPAWRMQATADPATVAQWWDADPGANVILVTGRVFDVLDVPARAGMAALALMNQASVQPGPVAISGNRAHFFVLTRGQPEDEDEWWSCSLDCEPEPVSDIAGLRWHCRDSYVVAPPSADASGQRARWLLQPHPVRPLPDAVRLLEFLADACDAGR